jgi:hypothetical protein
VNGSPEAQFVVASVRAFLNPEEGDVVRAAATRITDWLEVEKEARKHSVGAILAHVVARLLPGTLPEERLANLQAFARANARANLQLTAELLRLMKLFRQQEVKALPFKGPLLASTVYGNLGLRSFADLDILFSPTQVLAARDVLLAAGYDMRSCLHWNSDTAFLRSINSEFTMANRDVQVDVHWRPLPDSFPFRLDFASLWSDQSVVQLGGHSVPTFGAEHQLLFLAAHGAKHCWEKLGWLCDLARFLNVTEIDWDRALALSLKGGSVLVLSHALALARDVLGTKLPQQAEQLIAADERTTAIANIAAERLLHGIGRPGAIESLRFSLPFTTGAVGSLRLCHSLCLAPTEAEWSVLSLPPALYFLYYPLRIFRLGIKCIGRQ